LCSGLSFLGISDQRVNSSRVPSDQINRLVLLIAMGAYCAQLMSYRNGRPLFVRLRIGAFSVIDT
jgi:hypothetical protein